MALEPPVLCALWVVRRARLWRVAWRVLWVDMVEADVLDSPGV